MVALLCQYEVFQRARYRQLSVSSMRCEGRMRRQVPPGRRITLVQEVMWGSELRKVRGRECRSPNQAKPTGDGPQEIANILTVGEKIKLR